MTPDNLAIAAMLEKMDAVLVKGIEGNHTLFQVINSLRLLLNETEKQALNPKLSQIDKLEEYALPPQQKRR